MFRRSAFFIAEKIVGRQKNSWCPLLLFHSNREDLLAADLGFDSERWPKV